MPYFRLDPLRLYEIKNQVSNPLSAYLAATVANNQALVAAVSGKRIRVMGFILASTAAAIGTVLFKSASGGTSLSYAIAPSNAAATPDNKLPITLSGYFETVTGEGLYVDVGTTATNITVFYLVYSP